MPRRASPSVGQLDLFDGLAPTPAQIAAVGLVAVPPPVAEVDLAAPPPPPPPTPAQAATAVRDLARPRGVRVGGRRASK